MLLCHAATFGMVTTGTSKPRGSLPPALWGRRVPSHQQFSVALSHFPTAAGAVGVADPQDCWECRVRTKSYGQSGCFQTAAALHSSLQASAALSAHCSDTPTAPPVQLLLLQLPRGVTVNGQPSEAS